MSLTAGLLLAATLLVAAAADIRLGRALVRLASGLIGGAWRGLRGLRA